MTNENLNEAPRQDTSYADEIHFSWNKNGDSWTERYDYSFGVIDTFYFTLIRKN
jgi:hypothetical protein